MTNTDVDWITKECVQAYQIFGSVACKSPHIN